MIFKFGKKSKKGSDGQGDDAEVELIRFQSEFDVKANEKLVRVAIEPLKELLTDGLTRRAETIRIDPKGDRATIGFLIDGVPVPAGRIPRQRAHAVTQMTKVLAGMDAADRDKPQAAEIKASLSDDEYEWSVLTQPIAGGLERLTVHVRNLDEKLDKPEEIGMTDELKLKIRELTADERGVFLVCGPTRSGVTTTLYASVRGLDAYLQDIQTICFIEDRELINISKFETNSGDELEESLRRCVRVEPDVILLDPVFDAEVAKVIVGFHDKVTFMTEIASADAATGLLQWSEWIGDPALAAASLSGAVSQKLIRKLCNDCREAYKPNPKLLKKIGLDPEETPVLYRKARPPADIQRGEEIEPCRPCNDTGYCERVAVFEYIDVNEEIRQLIASGADAGKLRAQARSDEMLTLQKDAMRLVANGTTSLEELQRVFKT